MQRHVPEGLHQVKIPEGTQEFGLGCIYFFCCVRQIDIGQIVEHTIDRIDVLESNAPCRAEVAAVETIIIMYGGSARAGTTDEFIGTCLLFVGKSLSTPLRSYVVVDACDPSHYTCRAIEVRRHNDRLRVFFQYFTAAGIKKREAQDHQPYCSFFHKSSIFKFEF